MNGLGPIDPAAAGGATAPNSPARLRWACNELEAVFLDQLFQAMRESMPEGDPGQDTSGEDMFRSLLDQHVASVSAEREHGGLGETLYNQLVRRLSTEESQ